MADTGDFAQAELLARMNPVPDLGVQVRPTPQNVAALDQFRAERQRDFNWRNTFGQIPPADVLRETRDMISLTNRAIEQKMRLAAQTNHEAQNLWIKDQEFQEWQRQAPLRDELLKSQIERRKALTERETDRQIWENRKEAAQARYDTALESFMRKNPEATADELAKFTHRFASQDSDALTLEPVRRVWSEVNQQIRQERGLTAAGERQATGIAATGERQTNAQAFQAAENAKRLQQQADLSEKGRQQRESEALRRERDSAIRHLETAQRLRQSAGKAMNADEIKFADQRVIDAQNELRDIENRTQPATPPAAPANDQDKLKRWGLE